MPKRTLKPEEIEDILSVIKLPGSIPDDTAQYVIDNTKADLRAQLVTQKIYPHLIAKLKAQIEHEYFTSLIQPGESVGIVCAQSIGERQTQTTLNTFHSCGISDKTMTVGVPRFQELLNATKEPKMVNCKVYLNCHNSSIQDLREHVANRIVGLTLAEITKSALVETSKSRERWYAAQEILSGRTLVYQDCISFELDMHRMYDFRISIEMVAHMIEDQFVDIHCMCSPSQIGRLDVFVKTDEIELPDNRDSFHGTIDASLIYLEEVVKPVLDKITICGIQGINNIFYTQENEEWLIETDGSNFTLLLGVPEVDSVRTVSNNVWDIYNVLGIEAARAFLIEEFNSIMDGINSCHAKLLVEKMTFLGTISSISRYTLRREEAGPCSRASFEETMDNFLKAAAFGEKEHTRGVSASIICGKRSNIGTGAMELLVDVGMLANAPATIKDEVIEKPVRERLATIKQVGTLREQKPPETDNSDDDSDFGELPDGYFSDS